MKLEESLIENGDRILALVKIDGGDVMWYLRSDHKTKELDLL
jgi:hypothetical protein